LNLHPNTIRRWEKEGKIRVVRVGRGHRRIPEGEINRILRGIPPPIAPPAKAVDEKILFLNFVFSHHRDDLDLVKKAIFIRDNRACQECGSRENLEIHFKDGSSRNDPENLITLCRKCHQKIHAQGALPPEKPEIFEEKPILAPRIVVKEKPPQISKPTKLSRNAILEALAPTVAQRATFGGILSVAALLKKFTVQDLVTKARSPEIVVKTFCEQMEKLGYLRESEEGFELLVEVLT
jgi:excisionase family DNA binding protein